MLFTFANQLTRMTMQGERDKCKVHKFSHNFLSFRVNLPTGDGDNSDSNSSDELESVIESEPEHHVDFVSLGSN